MQIIVENIDILKKTFRELLKTLNLNVLFLLDVVIYYHMLHNMILNAKDIDIDELMIQLKAKHLD
jgi:hypothetical protein